MEKIDIYFLYCLPDKLPSLKRTLNIIVDYKIESDLEQTANSHHGLGGKTYQNGWRFEYHVVTTDEIHLILNLVKEATPAFSAENDAILQIINEEVPSYYSGQKRGRM